MQNMTAEQFTCLYETELLLWWKTNPRSLGLTFASWLFLLLVSQIFAWHFSTEIKNNLTPWSGVRSEIVKLRFMPDIGLIPHRWGWSAQSDTTRSLRRQRKVQRLGTQRERSQAIPPNSHLPSMCTPLPRCLWIKKKRLMFNTTSLHSCFSNINPALATSPASLHAFPYTIHVQ